MFWNPSIERIWKYNPRIKIIAILRNPAERAFSQWNMEKSRYDEVRKDFLEELEYETVRIGEALPLQSRFSYIERGLYAGQIKRIYRYFPENQVMFLKFEDFITNQESCLSKIFNFLGVDPELFSYKKVIIFPGNYNTKISAREKSILLPLFDADIKEVESLLNWDCSDWKK